MVPAFAEANLIARHPDAQVLNGIWERIMDCARAGALASGTRMEFVQGTNYANVLPNDALSEVLSRAMQKAGGYEYTPAERTFAQELQKTLGFEVKTPGPEHVQTDKSEAVSSASSDSGDVSWVVPTAQFTTATFVPGVGAHTWQAAACAGSSIGRKGMLVAARTLALAAVEIFRDSGGGDGRARGLHETPGRQKVDHARARGWQAAFGLRDEIGHSPRRRGERRGRRGEYKHLFILLRVFLRVFLRVSAVNPPRYARSRRIGCSVGCPLSNRSIRSQAITGAWPTRPWLAAGSEDPGRRPSKVRRRPCRRFWLGRSPASV